MINFDRIRTRIAHAAIDKANDKALHGDHVKPAEPRMDDTAPTAFLECLKCGHESATCECPRPEFVEQVARKRMSAMPGKGCRCLDATHCEHVKIPEFRTVGRTLATIESHRHWLACGCPPHPVFSYEEWLSAAYDANNIRRPMAETCPKCGMIACEIVFTSQPDGRRVHDPSRCNCCKCRGKATGVGDASIYLQRVEPSIVTVEPRYARSAMPKRVPLRFPLAASRRTQV